MVKNLKKNEITTVMIAHWRVPYANKLFSKLIFADRRSQNASLCGSYLNKELNFRLL